jgi:UDP-2,4-diacetamido-2,4,6-trideoxy-beta-L-altropyranose hydrolase
VKQTLLIRADASAAMGTGHAMRCIALAQAWQDCGGQAVFAMASTSPSIRNKLKQESIAVIEIFANAGTKEDADATLAAARDNSAAWIAIDGYQFGESYQHALTSANSKLFFVDDYGQATRYSANIVLNQNISADETLYHDREPYTRILLGLRYCLLRREFATWEHWRREIVPMGRRVLITMGGSDPINFTERALAAVNSLECENLEVAVVVGGTSEHTGSLKSNAAERKNITVFYDVANMAELMAWADVAISAAGTTCWEMCLLGLPMLLIDVAENQLAIARALDRQGCAKHLGSPKSVSVETLATELKQLLTSPEARRKMSMHGRELVDGDGAKRVVCALCTPTLRLRHVRENDSHLLWGWANEEQVRAASFSSGPITWEIHKVWFEKKLKQNGCRILIAESEDGVPVGQVRFDVRADEDYEIAVSIAKDWRGRGLAAPMIQAALANFDSKPLGRIIHAFIKSENSASLKSFARSGFTEIGVEEVRGQAAVHFIYKT